jgi:hypothetical protein
MDKINTATIEGSKVLPYGETCKFSVNSENLNYGTISASTLNVPKDMSFIGQNGKGKITIKEDGTFLVNDKPIVKDIELYNEMCKIFNIKPQKVFNNG